MDALFDIVGSGTLAVLFVIVVIVLLVAYITGRFKVAGANEALVRTGGLVKAPAQLKVVRAGRVVVLPLVHKLGKLHLSARQINVSLGDAVTKQGIKVAVQGVATVKIGGDDESIRNAAERFVDREDQIDSIVKNVLEGSLRSIVGHADRRGAQLRPPEVPAGGPARGQGRPRDVRPDDRQLHDPGDPRRGRLHGPHRPAGDGPPRAGRPHGQGHRRPGGRGPGGGGPADQAQRPARRRAPPGRGRSRSPRRPRQRPRRPGRWPRPRPSRRSRGARPSSPSSRRTASRRS